MDLPNSKFSQAILSDIAYHPFGPVAQFTYGSGLQARYGLDTSYRLQSITLGGSKTPLFERQFSYDAASQITAQTDPTQPDLSASYTYRPDGRLQQAVGPWGGRGYSYDSVGNRRYAIQAETGDQLQYNTAPDSNRLETIVNWTTGGVERKLTYDAAGSVIEDRREDGTEYSYLYAETGRLERVYAQGWTDKSQSEVATYTHDYRGLRVRRVGAGGAVRHFIFLPDGRLLGEYDGVTGQAVMEYIWLGDRLVAQMDAGGTLSHVLTGHLGQPLRIMAGDGAVLWAGEMDPFGRYYDTVHGAPHTASPLHLRLPGQWVEPGTGLYQNWHRDYDPSLGRYLQADPIGLAGGQSMYGYAYQNPMRFVDPEGLDGAWYDNLPSGYHMGGQPTMMDGYAAMIMSERDPQRQQDLIGEAGLAGAEVTANALLIASGTMGGASVCRFAAHGRELSLSKNLRIAPFGNRTGHPTGKWPHYHRGVPDRSRPGHSVDGQGMRRHRPWDKKSTDRTWRDRF